MIWNPWKEIRRLRAALEHERLVSRGLEHALGQSTDRYDQIRAANAQLRETLTLYRKGA